MFSRRSTVLIFLQLNGEFISTALLSVALMNPSLTVRRFITMWTSAPSVLKRRNMIMMNSLRLLYMTKIGNEKKTIRLDIRITVTFCRYTLMDAIPERII